MKNSLCMLSIASLLLMLPPAARSQGAAAPAGSKVERKNRAPVSREVLRVKLPRAFETTLSNGLPVLIIEDHRLPLVSMQINIAGAGPLYEPKDLPGLANITAQMLREGTRAKTSGQIAEEMDRLGASISASSGFGSSATVLSASGLADNMDQWFALATEILLTPSFPAEELERIKQRMKVQLRQQRANPNFLSNERFNRAIYGDHPAAVVSSNETAVDGFTVERIAEWHRSRYAPQNAILGIAGDVKPAQLIPKLEKWLAAWKKTDLREVLPANPTGPVSKRVLLVNRPNSVQTTVAIGNLAIDRKHSDYIALTVMNRVLGGGAAARLFLNLREEKGYTYGAYSTFSALKYPGSFRAYGDIRTEVTEGAMAEFFKEFARIRDEKVPPAELEEAKRSVIAGFALSLEDPDQLLGYAIVQKIYGFPADYWDNYATRIAAITQDEVQRVARKYINLDQLQVIAVGDATKIRGVFEKYGPVELFGTDGKTVSDSSPRQ